MENFEKLCPKCGSKQVYTTKYTRDSALKRNVCCNSCRGIERRVKIPDDGWIKMCPNCGKQQKYFCKSIHTMSIKKNKICLECSRNKKRIHNGIFHKKCKCGKTMNYSCRQSFNISKKHNSICRNCAAKESTKYIDKSFQKTDKYRNKMSESLKKSKIHKERMKDKSVREKLRIAKLKQIEILGIQINYNPKACEFIDHLNEINGWNLQHAMNGGEIKIGGYSLDGYDKERNIVFEYDEPKHNIKCIKEKDNIREKILIEKINPSRFLRYDEKKQNLYDVIVRKEE